VGRIKSAVINLTGILNDFLSLSKLEEGKIELNFGDVDFGELCNLVSDEVKGLF
jgi:signal transduction histidine kinase